MPAKGSHKPESAKFIPADQVALLLRAPFEAGHPRDGHLFAALFYLALRVGEAVLLTPVSFDLAHGVVRVPSLKKRRWKVRRVQQPDGSISLVRPTPEERAAARAEGPVLLDVPVLPEAVAPLAALAAWSAGRAWCFAGGRTGSHMTPRTAEYIFARWRDGLGLDKAYTPHSLRHSACSMLAATTKDPVLVRDFARHESVTTTDVYLHRGPGRWLAAGGALSLPGGAA